MAAVSEVAALCSKPKLIAWIAKQQVTLANMSDIFVAPHHLTCRYNCTGLLQIPVTVLLIIIMTLRGESVQPASSGRDETWDWAVLSWGWTDAGLRDWAVWWEDRLSPPVWEFLSSLLDGPEGRLNSVFDRAAEKCVFVSCHPASTTSLLKDEI